MSDNNNNNQQQQQNSGNNNNTIQLDEMSLDQLDQLKQREENRMQLLTTRYAQLRQAAARLMSSQTAVQELQDIFDQDNNVTKSNESKTTSTSTKVHDVFVPLTESVYVPGKIRCDQPGYNHLLVELGTGYFVEQTPADTIQYINRKVRLVDANSNNGTLFLL